MGADVADPRRVRRLRGAWAVRRCGKNFTLRDRHLPGYPTVVNAAGVPHRGVAAYFEERATFLNATVGTLVDEAYILANWLNELARVGVRWDEADDDRIVAWARRQEQEVSKRRVSHKIGVVHSFYEICQRTLGIVDKILDAGGAAAEEVVPLMGERLHPDGSKQPRFHYPTLPERRTGRPTPNGVEVQTVLETASARSTEFASVSHWLIASLASSTGLRAGGNASISLRSLSEGLLEERIGELSSTGKLVACDLASAAEDGAKRGRILTELGRKGTQGRKNIFCEVTEKGSKTRSVAIPISLATLLLEFVWDQRHAFVIVRQKNVPGYRPPATLFVSMKTGRSYTPDAISNLLKRAFNEGGVRGSGHRLRAYFAEQVVHDAYMRAKAKHGRAFDVATILTVAAEALGHSDTKTLRRYLNRILRRDQLAEGFPIVVRDPAVADTLRGLAAAADDGVPEVAERLARLARELSIAPIPAPELPGAPKAWADRPDA